MCLSIRVWSLFNSVVVVIFIQDGIPGASLWTKSRVRYEGNNVFRMIIWLTLSSKPLFLALSVRTDWKWIRNLQCMHILQMIFEVSFIDSYHSVIIETISKFCYKIKNIRIPVRKYFPDWVHWNQAGFRNRYLLNECQGKPAYKEPLVSV